VVPLRLDYEDTHRGAHWLIAFGRLAPGVSV
jgi:putative ABC transport system permease protein